MLAVLPFSVLARRVVVLIAVACVAAAMAGASSSGNGSVIASNPTWSPDGKAIAFAYATSQTYRIVTMPVTGGAIRTVYSSTNGGCCDPMLWSRTGRIVFVNNYSLISVAASGGKPKRLAVNAQWFILSPNGATAAWDEAGQQGPLGIGLVDVTDGSPTPVPRPASESDAVYSFSPDGTELVFGRASLTGASPSTLMVERLRGGAPLPLSRSGLIGQSRLPADAVDAQWSPDGRWIALVHRGKLEVVNTRGGQPQVLAAWVASGFSWSPRSTLLACLCGPNHEHLHLTTLNPQGTRKTILWTNRSLHYLNEDSWDRPQWSPNGSKLAFLARTGPGNPPTHVWVVNANGTGLKRIA